MEKTELLQTLTKDLFRETVPEVAAIKISIITENEKLNTHFCMHLIGSHRKHFLEQQGSYSVTITSCIESNGIPHRNSKRFDFKKSENIIEMFELIQREDLKSETLEIQYKIKLSRSPFLQSIQSTS